jgi:Abnormal spindle-like microcephaly-assoc'd, ASPM-SPD-2-Hydin
MKLAEGKTMHVGGTAEAKGLGARQEPVSLRQVLNSIALSTALLCTGIVGGCAGIVTGTKTTTGQAAFHVNPTAVNFGNVGVGKQTTQTIAVANTGKMPVSITQAASSNPQFSLTGVTLPVSLATGETGSFTVSVTPSAIGNLTGTLTVHGSNGAAPAVVNLSATAVASAAAISLTPSSANFGSVAVGATNSQTIQIGNTGNSVLTITQASVTGSGFSTTGLTLPLSINPGSSSTFNAQYQPAAMGAASGSITIVSNAATSPSAIALTGTGVAATQTLSFSTSAVSFGNVDNGTSSTQAVTVTNVGNSNVQISQIAASGTEYSLNGAGAPVTLAPTQKLTFSVIFSPTATGAAVGSVTITSNATGSPGTITLSGTGIVSVPHTVGLSWTGSTSVVSGYNVYRSTTSGSGYTRLNGILVTPVNYTDSTVVNGKTYYYVTTAVDGTGAESAYSNEAVAVIP